MKIGVIIPDRGDRHAFTNQCFKMLKRQVLIPDYVELINDKSISTDFDLTKRVKLGYDKLRDKCDIIFIIENDDWYHFSYIKTMYEYWILHSKPEMIGIGYTYYYHLKYNKYVKIKHSGRSSLFCTAISGGLSSINWGADNNVFLDLHLWEILNGKTFIPQQIIAIGMKHGIGLCGGKAHNCKCLYKDDDSNREWLKKQIDNESLKFYEKLFE